MNAGPDWDSPSSRSTTVTRFASWPFRVVAELCPLEGSEGPSGGAAGLLGGDRVGIFRQELVDVPRWRAGAGGAVLVSEAAVGHGRRPAALGEHLGEAP